MARPQVRMFVVTQISQLKDVSPAPSDMICLIVTDVRYVYNTLDRINNRTIIIGPDTFSETVSIKLYQKHMLKYKLKHMALIADSDLVENDIHEVVRRANPDDLIRLG